MIKREGQRNITEVLKDLTGLPFTQVSELEAISELQSYTKAESFVRSGDKGDQLGIVTKGIFRAYYLTEDGKRFIRKFYRPNDFMGAFATAISQEPAHVTIDAMEDSQVLKFSYAIFCKLRDKHPAWERLNRILLEQNYVQRERRAYQLLAFDATKRYSLFQEEYRDIFDRIPKTDIASYLGISPESLSRITSKK